LVRLAVDGQQSYPSQEYRSGERPPIARGRDRGCAALRRLGALAAYRRLKHAFPRQVSLVMLYALEGALRDCHWNHLPPAVKERLKAAAAKPRS
jgi:hypothetical protein